MIILTQISVCFLHFRVYALAIKQTAERDTGSLSFSCYYDNRITIAHFGGKQMANSNAGSPDKVSLSADIVAAYVSHNSVTQQVVCLL